MTTMQNRTYRGETPDADLAVLESLKYDPRLFAKTYFRRDLMDHQVEIAKVAIHPNWAPAGNKYTAVRSCHGVGKSFTAGVCVIQFMMSRKNPVVITTAPTWAQVKSILWNEIRSLIGISQLCPFRLPSGTIIRGIPGKPNQTDWELGPKWVAFGLSTNESNRFQGRHGESVMVVIDEASGVDDEIFNVIENVAVGDNDKIFAIGNPTSDSGWFHDIFNNSTAGRGWKKIHLDAEAMPWIVNRTAPPVPGVITYGWVDDKRAKWADRFPDIYEIRVRGNFASAGSNMTIPLKHIEACCAPPPDDAIDDPGAVVAYGCDVARYGSDMCVVVRMVGNRQTDIEKWSKTSVTETAGRIIAIYNRMGGGDVIAIDADGLGAGVLDILAEKGFPVIGHQGAAAAYDARKFANARAENYFALAEVICAHEMTLIDDEDQTPQLAYLPYKYDSQGRILIESKEVMRRQGHASPDAADAVMMAHWASRWFVSGGMGTAEVTPGAMT